MTDDKLAPRALAEHGSDTTYPRETIGFAADRLMPPETDTLCGAGRESFGAGAGRQAAFGAKAPHQPLGLILPATSLHASGGKKLTHMLQWFPPFG